jgi:drug/metabolite transporter (DMT)-like permease
MSLTPAAAIKSKNEGLLVWLAAITTIVLWASVYLALKISLAAFSPGEVGFLRSFLGSVVLLVQARMVGMPLPTRAQWPEIAIIGAVGFFLYPIFLNYGQLFVDAGTTSLIINATPAITALIAILFLGERLPLLGGLGILISFAGVAINAYAVQAGHAQSTLTGIALLLAAALARALHFLLQKRTLHKLTALQVTCCSMLVGTACLLPWGGSAVAAIPAAPFKCLIAVAYLGIFPSAVAYATWAFVLARMPASVATNILSLIPVLAVVMAVMFLGERPEPLVYLGGAVTITGVLLVQRRKT